MNRPLTKEEIKPYKIRHHLTLLDRPMFIPSIALAKSSEYSDDAGYTIISKKHGLPTIFDKQLLYMLLERAQTTQSRFLTFKSIREIISIMNLPDKGQSYLRVRESINKWALTNIIFEEDKLQLNGRVWHEKITIAVLPEVVFADDSLDINAPIHIELSERFYKYNQDRFSMLLDYKTLRKFDNAFSLRLYEVLVKNFYGRKEWRIGIRKLVIKLGAQFDQRNKVVNRIDKAVEDIKCIHRGRFSNLDYYVGKNNVIIFKIY